MSSSLPPGRGVLWAPLIAAALLGGCAVQPSPPASRQEASGDAPPLSQIPPPDNGAVVPPGASPSCDRSLSVKGDGRGLVIQDPAVLSRFTLERVLAQLISLSGDGPRTPLDILQRLFDTENTSAGGAFSDIPHCDSQGNLAFANGAPIDCPRAEGALARSAGLLTPGHPDYFAPIALVNRLDLASDNLESCGEYRLVFAKWSGRSDPANRLFLIFEGSLATKGRDLMSCLPAARLWAGLEQQKDPAVIAARLESFYFTGYGGLPPLVHPSHFGLFSTEAGSYGGSQRGQVRVSQRMQAPWEMREFHLKTTGASRALTFNPVTVKNNPLPALFDPGSSSPQAPRFQADLADQVAGLSSGNATGIRMALLNMWSAGQSALAGPAQTDYLSRARSGGASSPLFLAIAQQLTLTNANAKCPTADPLTPESIVARATTQTCAGCHAPEQFLGPERKLGCGVVWPTSLGGAHIDEMGKLSPALTDVLLPMRAAVMTTFVQACDMRSILMNLQPTPKGGIPLPK